MKISHISRKKNIRIYIHFVFSREMRKFSLFFAKVRFNLFRENLAKTFGIWRKYAKYLRKYSFNTYGLREKNFASFPHFRCFLFREKMQNLIYEKISLGTQRCLDYLVTTAVYDFTGKLNFHCLSRLHSIYIVVISAWLLWCQGVCVLLVRS